MRIVFLSNYFTHHQKPVAEALIEVEADYHFIATQDPEKERLQMGWCANKEPEYVCQWKLEPKKAEELLATADAIITGSAPEILVKKAIQAGKLVVRYAERPLKKGIEPLKYLPRLFKWRRNNPKNKPIYLLCASAYTAGDYRKFGLFRGRAYRWGYFPETKNYDANTLMAGKNRKRLLWCGRFLDWKHPDDAIRAAAQLKKEGFDFQLDIAGGGEMEAQLKALTRSLKLEDTVNFLGFQKPEDIRKLMENAGIYLFTSDRQEGWGAVLNEAMNSGCAVVASDAIGSVPYLLENGENGLIYSSGDLENLCDNIRSLLQEPSYQEQLGREAYRTIAEEWNAHVAARRLLALVEELRENNSCDLYLHGPCSKV